MKNQKHFIIDGNIGRPLLFALCLTLSITASAQTNLYIGGGLGLNGNVLYSTGSDSLKYLYSLTAAQGTGITVAQGTASSAQSTANTANSQATSALNVANGAVSVNTAQTKSIDSLRNRVKTLENGIPIVTGPISPNVQTSSYTATQNDHAGCIVMKTASTSVTLPQLLPGTTIQVRNISIGTVTFRLSGVSPAGGSVTGISKNGAYRTVYYITSNLVDVR